jgi:outer membrane protein assembly factor BamB
MTVRRAKIILAILISLAAPAAPAADWPQWGRDFTRNAVSSETGVPDFQFPLVEDGKVVRPARNLAWQAELGYMTVIPPVVSGGLVWVGTNFVEPPGDPPPKGWDRARLLCFRESDGKLLWTYSVPRRTADWVNDFPRSAHGSAPLAEGDRLWFVDSRNDVVCLDVGPLQRGTGEPKVLWKLDTVAKLGVYPHRPLMQAGSAASVAGYKDWLYVVTHNGVDDTHAKVAKPDAPSLVCLEKATGKVVWTDNSPGKGILDVQISSPLVAEVGSKVQVIVGQGDGWLRSFDAATGKLIWKCDLNPKAATYLIGGRGDRNYVVATPVLYDGRIYIPTGHEVEHGDGPGCLYCIDPTKSGDVSRELDDGPGKGKPNPNSAVVWHTLGPFPDGVPDSGNTKDFLKYRDGYLFGRAVASCTVHDGLVYAADLAGFVHCFDARSGKPCWIHDLRACVLGQPLWVEGRVYVVNEDGDVFVFAHGKQKKTLAKIEAVEECRSGLVLANQTVYIPVRRTLYAFRAPK